MAKPAALYKIVLVLDDTLDTNDGVQQYVVNVGKWLSSRGHEVHYIVGETKRRDIPHIHSIGKNVKVTFNGNQLSIPRPVSRASIRRLLQQEQFDIVHVQVPYSPLLAGRIIHAAGPKTAVVGTFHIAPLSSTVRVMNHLLGVVSFRTLARFDAVASVSRTAQIFAQQAYRLPSSVIPNTIDLSPYRSAQALEKYASSFNIIFFGRLVSRKGCDLFLKAVNRLVTEQPTIVSECRVIVCGTGPMEGALKRYVHEQQLESIVEFAGFITEADKPKYLAAGDVIVYPSIGGESFGIVLLEGMAAGRGAVIAGDNSGYRDVMGSKSNVLFDPTNEKQFAAMLHRYITDKNLRHSTHDWQKQHVAQYDLPQVGEKIEAMYAAALHKRNK